MAVVRAHARLFGSFPSRRYDFMIHGLVDHGNLTHVDRIARPDESEGTCMIMRGGVASAESHI